MPELPEVETVRRQLAGSLLAKRFAGAEQIEPAMLLDCSAEEVRTGLPGRKIQSVERLGKFLVVRLDAGAFLTLHLGMTGQLLVDPKEGPGPHTRFLFRLEGGRGGATTLEFRDARKFGRLHLTTGGPPARLRALGPDAWQGTWDAAYLESRLRGRKIPLKAFLLDQSHLSGIGNIYADEILWWTGLSPLRPGGSLNIQEVVRLSEEIPRRLDEGVRLLGCTLQDFVDTAGEPGEFQDWLQAYGRQGQVCTRCGGTFVRAVVGGRGTAYCPGCQH
ncbi:MAG: bifunctional DNA-formamidopyrimidine glycosylase/DNA-(apurinic or apyrimidinic site) lyase [Thermoleophilia bacterium]|nr:bifunctional DNA-formamidopyrimidine glycosylase/DNA-(apurinic or apyrimidinic site) lyase [Thermoleophilia bacterium]